MCSLLACNCDLEDVSLLGTEVSSMEGYTSYYG